MSARSVFEAEIGEFRVIVDHHDNEVGIVASGDRYREVPRELVDALSDAYAALDPKHRGPAYRRGFADGVLTGRAGITDTRLPNDDEEDDRG